MTKPESIIVAPGLQPGTFCTADKKVLTVPADWELLPPGDAGLTRRVKAAGPSWTVREKVRGKDFSRGVYAAATTIAAQRTILDAERSTPAYANRQQSAAKRRDKEQATYVEDFHGEVVAFLAFDPAHQAIAVRLASAVTQHATPVGSGTVARTERIPIEQRAESAVLAWMRHQTTSYDHMKIARVKGQRRQVRRELAQVSRQILSRYRRGSVIPEGTCPLQSALASSTE